MFENLLGNKILLTLSVAGSNRNKIGKKKDYALKVGDLLLLWWKLGNFLGLANMHV